MFLLSDFKRWLDNCERDAKDKGLTEAELYLAYLERVETMTINRIVEVKE